MKSLDNKITETGGEVLKEMIKVLENNGFKVTVKDTEPIVEYDDDLLPEFTLSKNIFDKLSSLGEWEVVDLNTEAYELILHRTQGLKPINYGSTLDYRYAEYELDGMVIELSWDLLLTNSRPTIKRKIKNI